MTDEKQYKYKTKKYDDTLIERVVCLRETEKSVVIEERRWCMRGEVETVEARHPKMAEYDQYHDTWDAARDYLMKRAQQWRLRAQSQLDQASDTIKRIASLSKPADPPTAGG